MSYDVDFSGPDFRGESWKNYTSNVSVMWAKALGENLGDLIERVPVAAEILERVQQGVRAMEDDPDTYRAMEPENGWGSYQGALDYLRWIADTARANPASRITVSR